MLPVADEDERVVRVPSGDQTGPRMSHEGGATPVAVACSLVPSIAAT
jgi:hypothetical protein